MCSSTEQTEMCSVKRGCVCTCLRSPLGPVSMTKNLVPLSDPPGAKKPFMRARV